MRRIPSSRSQTPNSLIIQTVSYIIHFQDLGIWEGDTLCICGRRSRAHLLSSRYVQITQVFMGESALFIFHPSSPVGPPFPGTESATVQVRVPPGPPVNHVHVPRPNAAQPPPRMARLNLAMAAPSSSGIPISRNAETIRQRSIAGRTGGTTTSRPSGSSSSTSSAPPPSTVKGKKKGKDKSNSVDLMLVFWLSPVRLTRFQ